MILRATACAALCLLAADTPAQQRQAPPIPPGAVPRPRLEPVAETKLVCEGLNQSNLRGLGRSLGRAPLDIEGWAVARGQALLIAEAGNLLLLRPPRSGGLDTWFERSVAQRTAGQRLARAASARDYQAAKLGLVELTAACNRCHQTFRVPARANPFDDVGPVLPPPAAPVLPSAP